MELDRELYLKKGRQAVCLQLRNWDDQTDPEAYMDNFELVMNEDEIPKTEWISIIRKQLMGKALLAYQEIAPDILMLYHTFKARMLDQLGATLEQARQTVWLSKTTMDEGQNHSSRRSLEQSTG